MEERFESMNPEMNKKEDKAFAGSILRSHKPYIRFRSLHNAWCSGFGHG